jgi:hypothetical protein
MSDMPTNTYTISGKDGELFLAVNGFVLAYAEVFTAKLTERLKEMSFRAQRWTMPDGCTAKLILRNLSNPHPCVIQEIVGDLTGGKPLDFEFRGYYKSKDGFNYPVKFQRLIPVNGDLDDFLSGYVGEWEFNITLIDDNLIDKFKKTY